MAQQYYDTNMMMQPQAPPPAANNNLLIGAVIAIAAVAGYMYYMAQQELTQMAAVLKVQTTDVLTMMDALNKMSDAAEQVPALTKNIADYKTRVANAEGQLEDANSQLTTLRNQLATANTNLSKTQVDLQTYQGKNAALDKQLKDTLAAVTAVNDFILTTYIGTGTQQQQDLIANLSAIRNVASGLISGQFKKACDILDQQHPPGSMGGGVPRDITTMRQSLIWMAQNIGQHSDNRICDPNIMMTVVNNFMSNILPTVQQCVQPQQPQYYHGGLALFNSPYNFSINNSHWYNAPLNGDNKMMVLQPGPGRIIARNTGSEWVFWNLDNNDMWGKGNGFTGAKTDNPQEWVDVNMGIPNLGMPDTTCTVSFDTDNEIYKAYVGIQNNIAVLINMGLSTVCVNGIYNPDAGVALINNLINMVCGVEYVPTLWNKIFDYVLGPVAKSFNINNMATAQSISSVATQNVANIQKINTQPIQQYTMPATSNAQMASSNAVNGGDIQISGSAQPTIFGIQMASA